jgi:hypothetical protein
MIRRPEQQLQRAERPIFVLTIEYGGTAGFEIHALRKLLKSLIRVHHFRCRAIEQIEGPQ